MDVPPETTFIAWMGGLVDKFESALAAVMLAIAGTAYFGVQNLFRRLSAVERSVKALDLAKLAHEAEMKLIELRINDMPTRKEMFDRLDQQSRQNNEILALLYDRRNERNAGP